MPEGQWCGIITTEYGIEITALTFCKNCLGGCKRARIREIPKSPHSHERGTFECDQCLL